MRRLHKAMVTVAVIGALLAAGANLWPTIAEAAQAPPTVEPRSAARPITADADRRSTTPRPASSERAGRWTAPVGPIEPATGFDPPPLPWLPGHRGVDLASVAG